MSGRDQWEEALQEAYASNPSNDVIVHTLEFRNADIVDESGNAIGIRIARSPDDFEATLERDAPLNAGEVVTFSAANFDFTLPTTREGETPKLKLSVANAGRIIIDPIMQVTSNYNPIAVRYRPYLSSNPTVVQMDPPLDLRLHAIKVDLATITGIALFDDVMNKVFPGELYTKDKFPLLFTQD